MCSKCWDIQLLPVHVGDHVGVTSIVARERILTIGHLPRQGEYLGFGDPLLGDHLSFWSHLLCTSVMRVYPSDMVRNALPSHMVGTAQAWKVMLLMCVFRV
jgi:hypothetical protein